jgi:hypothetical protein
VSIATASIPQDIGLLSCRSNITSLQIANQRNLDGTLPESLGQLLALTFIDVSSSGLVGPIPASLGNLERLQNLQACCQKLNGTVSFSTWRRALAMHRGVEAECLSVACRFLTSWARS